MKVVCRFVFVLSLLLIPGTIRAQQEESQKKIPVDPRSTMTAERALEIIRQVTPGEPLLPETWPGGKRVAVALTFDVDAELVWMDDPEKVSLSNLSRGQYGVHAGLDRILKLLGRRGISATFFFPALITKMHPEAVGAIMEQKRHEIGYHGYAHESVVTLSETEEREVMSKALELLRKSGIQPKVYRSPSWDFSPSTIKLLSEFGFQYDSSLMGDDRPHVIHSWGKPTGIIEFPVDWALDDWPYFQLDWDVPWTGERNPEEVLQIWKEEFEGIRLTGAVFILTMHPQVIGRWSRIRMLERLLDHIDSTNDAWYATLSEIGTRLRP